MSVSKTSDHIKINIKMPNPSQEPTAPIKTPNQDLKDIGVLWTFKIKIKNMGVSKTSDQIQIKLKMPNHSQGPSVSSKATNQEFKDMNVFWTFKIKIKSQNLDYGCI